jgi:hypothetical protein
MYVNEYVNYFRVADPKSAEVASLLPLLQFWMSDDPQIRSDRERVKTICREDICRK